MKFNRTALSLTILALSLWLAEPPQAIGQSPVRIAQENGSKISIENIRDQVENRLKSIWSQLPGITNGTADFDFTIKKDGSLALLKTLNSSGNPSFDNAAKGTIKRVVPLPNLPAYLEVNALNLRAKFVATPNKSVKVSFAPLNFGASSNAFNPTKSAGNQLASTTQNNPQSSNRAHSPNQNSASNQNKPAPKANNSAYAKKLVNLGVVAMNAGDYKTAIEKLEEAIRINPNYTLAKKNLAIAYNNNGLKLQSKPNNAIKAFHRALFLDPQNSRTQKNLEAIITIMGKSPNSFQDRKNLGDIALKEGDKNGARIEYLAALKIKNSPEVQKQLNMLDGRFSQLSNNLNKTTKPIKPKAKIVAPPKTKPQKTVKKIPQKTKQQKPKVRTTQTKNKLDNVYMRVANLEKRFYKKVFSNDDILTRISRLEKKAFGAVQSGSPKRRLDALLLAE